MRELMVFLLPQVQIGNHPVMNAGASPGFSPTACQSAIFALNSREVGKFVPARLEGATPKAPCGPRTDIAQGVKAGYCSRCTRATYVATPPAYGLGEFS